MVVVPVIAILTLPSILQNLKAQENEVARIFTHPLRAMLDPDPCLANGEPLVEKGSEDWPYDSEHYHPTDSMIPLLGNTPYRMHRFRTAASPIKGLTADILIKTAQIVYGRPTSFSLYAPQQLQTFAEMSRLAVDLRALESNVKPGSIIEHGHQEPPIMQGGIAQLGEQ